VQLSPSKRPIVRAADNGGSGAAKGMEFGLVLVFFFGLGWMLDSIFGTWPLLGIVFLALGVIGQFARVWYAYDAEMRGHEERMREGRTR